jgi:hypothetical protein
MKKKIACLVLSSFIMMGIAAQSGEDDRRSHGKGKANAVSVSFDLPFAVFSDTHRFGFGLDYSWSKHRYGRMNEELSKPIGFTCNAGVDYYTGKEDSYGFHFTGYTIFHGYGGLIYNPGKKGNISLTTGPTLGIYGGVADLGVGVNLNGSYYLAKNIAIAAGIIFMKHTDADPLWVGTLRASFAF